MGWKLIEKPNVVRATNALATKFMGMEPVPNDRPLSGARKKILRNAIIEGRFRTCEWAEVFCKETGKTYRVNGKHTSTIISEMNGEAPKDLCIIHEKYEADKLSDIANLYATFDVRASNRTTNDINAAYAASVPELAQLPKRIINVSVTGMSYSERSCKSGGNHHGSALPEERAQKLLIYPEFPVFVNRIVSKPDSCRHILRGPVVAAMKSTWDKNKTAASEFWQLVRDESHPSNKDATRTLAKFLNRARVRSNARSVDESISEVMMYVKCLHAWNAWRKGEATTLQYHADKPVPALV